MNEIYLDNAATTRVDDKVIEAMVPLYNPKYGNPSSLHLKGQEAKRLMEEAALEIVTNGLLKAEVTVSNCWEK